MKNAVKLFVSLFTITFFCLVALASGNSDSDKKTECNSSSQGYKTGYEVGKSSLWSDPETYKRECNNGYGMIGEVPECWDEGFIDGYNSKK